MVTTIDHPELVKLIQLAYSAERAAAFAYVGHANSLKDPAEKEALSEIEADEWVHRADLLQIMRQYDIPVSRWYEIRFWITGRIIGAACHLIGWFMPYYFAGRLESGNVCEYFRMMHFFEEVGITEHHDMLYGMGITEAKHEAHFLDGIGSHRLLTLFERVFAWGQGHSYNDVDLHATPDDGHSSDYCREAKLGRVRLLDRPSSRP